MMFRNLHAKYQYFLIFQDFRFRLDTSQMLWLRVPAHTRCGDKICRSESPVFDKLIRKLKTVVHEQTQFDLKRV